jgi:hypothetical protein
MPNENREYPAWRFNESGESVVVKDEDEDDSLPDGWLSVPPKGFKPEGAPTYSDASQVPEPIDIEAIAAKTATKPATTARKPGRPPKAATPPPTTEESTEESTEGAGEESDGDTTEGTAE